MSGRATAARPDPAERRHNAGPSAVLQLRYCTPSSASFHFSHPSPTQPQKLTLIAASVKSMVSSPSSTGSKSSEGFSGG